MDPETKSERFSVSMRPSIMKKLKEVVPNVNEYMEELVILDLLRRKAVTEEELKDIMVGMPA